MKITPMDCKKKFAKLLEEIEYGGEAGGLYWQDWILIEGVPYFEKTIHTIIKYNRILAMADRLPDEVLAIIKGDIE